MKYSTPPNPSSDDGNKRLRVKFNVEGPEGKGQVFAQMNPSNEDFEYIIFTKADR